MLKQDDYQQFFQAMVAEIDVHESRRHWTVMHRSDLPPGTKTIRAIWSFKRKRYPDGTLNKLDYAHMVANKPGVGIIGIHMLRL